MPVRRNKGSLDLYSDGKVSGQSDHSESNSLLEWVRERQGRPAPQRLSPKRQAARKAPVQVSESSVDDEMTYVAPRNFLTQPMQEPSDYEPSNSEYDEAELLEDAEEREGPEDVQMPDDETYSEEE